ncbi:MAG TPA: hypothetical protein VNJ01_15725 [Bacteriovoracaceae bacterium]|nr:hypothetical protein [Bacteriovoracaceae bacterium]
MKLKRSTISSQLLILTLAVLVLLFMVQVARAQGNNDTQSMGSASTQNQRSQGGIIQIGMPQKSLGRKLIEDTSLTYYQSFLGPTASGPSSETYNVFQEGRAPLQSFHIVNLRHQINADWGIGVSLAAVNGYTKEVETSPGNFNKPEVEFFNARANLTTPSFNLFNIGKVFTVLSFEAPTSEISRNDEMRYGLLIAQTINFNLPSKNWTFGLSHQAYRMYYKNNLKNPPFSFAQGGRYVPLQTMILQGGPFANYRFNDKWLFASTMIFDWDQRGLQQGSREFGNNLPHRARAGVSYYPNVKYLSSVGLFSQANLKFDPSTTAFGADFTVRF